MTQKILDVAGIGLGPSNLALAIALKESSLPLSYTFLDNKSQPNWQEQMLISGSDIQNNPLRDLVTPRNPQSYYTFTNYLKVTNRLFDYLNLPGHYPLRREYAEYIKWTASHFTENIISSAKVTSLGIATLDGQKTWEISYNNTQKLYSRAIIIGTGRAPHIPTELSEIVASNKAFHLNNYLENIEKFPKDIKRIGVLGASQSAVEIVLDLAARFPQAEIYSIHRSFSFKLKDTSPFSDKVYFPEFVDYYYSLDSNGKRNIDRQLRGTNYSSADADVINALYTRIHEDKLRGVFQVKILNNTAISHARILDSGEILLQTTEVNKGTNSELQIDRLVLATGFKDIANKENGELIPRLLEPFSADLMKDQDGSLHVNRDYSLTTYNQIPPAYLNGLCESSHGLGDAGSFSLVSLRAEHILDSLKTRYL